MTWSVATPTCVAPSLEQLEHDADHAADRADLEAVVVEVRRQRVVVPEQLVRAVDQVHLHPAHRSDGSRSTTTARWSLTGAWSATDARRTRAPSTAT